MGKDLSNEEREKHVAEDIWLNYFNQYLFEHGTISEKEYKMMIEKIATRKARRVPKRNANETVSEDFKRSYETL